MAMRAVTCGGRTLARYSADCFSKSSHDGMLTTRTRTDSARSLSYAATASGTSLPVAIRISSGAPSESADQKPDVPQSDPND